MRYLAALVVCFALLAPRAAAQFEYGYLYVADCSGDMVYEIDPATLSWRVFAEFADGLDGPSALCFTRDGYLLVASYHSGEVLRFDAAGRGTVVLDAGDGIDGPFGQNGIAVDGTGRIYVADYVDGEIWRFAADYTGGVLLADRSEGIVAPDGLAIAANGDVLVANRGSGGQVLQIDALGAVTVFDTIAGEDALSLAIRDSGDIYVACCSGNVYRYLGGQADQRVRLGAYGALNSGLTFGPDFAMLYHASAGDGKLRAIHPDSGEETVLMDEDWDGLSVAVAGSADPPGSIADFGEGLPGSGGHLPTLHGLGVPFLGGSLTLECRDFLGGCTVLQLFGVSRHDRDLFSGTLYVSLLTPYQLRLLVLPGADPGEGDVDLTYQIPGDPALARTHWYFQHLGLDPGAVQGVSMTNGVVLYVGE